MKKTEGTVKGSQKAGSKEKQPQISSDMPLSEKDEVKQAEEKLRKEVKKHS